MNQKLLELLLDKLRWPFAVIAISWLLRAPFQSLATRLESLLDRTNKLEVGKSGFTVSASPGVVQSEAKTVELGIETPSNSSEMPERLRSATECDVPPLVNKTKQLIK